MRSMYMWSLEYTLHFALATVSTEKSQKYPNFIWLYILIISVSRALFCSKFLNILWCMFKSLLKHYHNALTIKCKHCTNNANTPNWKKKRHVNQCTVWFVKHAFVSLNKTRMHNEKCQSLKVRLVQKTGRKQVISVLLHPSHGRLDMQTM